jgi:pimeloyl-ACP methyl ester carboxylesterase
MHVSRRECVRLLGASAIGTALSRHESVHATVRFRVEGSGPNLIVGPPITLAPDPAGMARAYLERLTSAYRVITMDYFPAVFDHESFTVDRVTSEILAVADAAEADRFAWYGFSWAGAAGLQLALRTDRLTALVCGGWSPLGGLYEGALGELRGRNRQGRSGSEVVRRLLP